MLLSVVVPIYNEQENIAPLLAALRGALKASAFEIILVDDGSTDGTIDEVLKETDHRIRLIAFARNYGQTSAIAAGIQAAEGDYIVTMDGDLQNDPADIPMMLDKMKSEDLDVVVGYRKRREDGMILRKIPSKIANWVIRSTSKVQVRDYGCTLKLFKRDIAKKLDLYGELHRFIPILSTLYGAKIAEVEVRHHPRRYGKSKYGLGRTLRVVSDLLFLLFLQKFRQKPMHFFGGLGIAMFILGSLIETYLLMLKFSGEDIGGRPLFYVGLLFLITSVQLITAGFIAELTMRIYFESQSKTPYSIAREYEGGKKV